MHVLTRTEGLDQCWVFTKVRHQAKLDLRIVGTEERTALLGDEGFTDGSSLGGTYGDILDVGITAGETTRSRNGLVKGRVDLPIWVDQLGERLYVGTEELLHSSVVEDLLYHRVLVSELLQHLFARGIASCLCLLRLLHDLQFVEEGFAYLPTAIDIDAMPEQETDLTLETSQLTL